MKIAGTFVAIAAAAAVACSAAAARGPLPKPDLDAALATSSSEQHTVVSGGCFWGIQAVFQHVKGVVRATSGYAGGEAATAHYDMVGSGQTGHAESVEVVFDPSQVTYGQLLRVFFSVAHDPTTLNRQGPDYGPQYRSALFVVGDEQARIARAYIEQIDRAHLLTGPIVTEVGPLKGFYTAEEYHQDYATLHPNDLYIMMNDAPKVRALKATFPELWSESKSGR